MPEQMEGFLLDNHLEYLTGYRYKNGLQDLRKAQ